MVRGDDWRRFWSSVQARCANPSAQTLVEQSVALSSDAQPQRAGSRRARPGALRRATLVRRPLRARLSHRQLLPLTLSPFSSRTPPLKTAEEDGVGRCFSRIGPFST
ncbi:hypothetical protein C2S51_038610 [Perilla frutescens var. frutescens]|nr:hypothetical protein C2S51_038610 [Perilla frutescens var. frutescens]